VPVSLANTDFVMNNLFWIGVYPGLSPEMLDYVMSTFRALPVQIGVGGVAK
jgi:CDP-6-deoxy-D-xylo-4-hexulose-3-dehydrase